MALISCPECGKQISDHAVACPNCGYPIAGSISYTAVPSDSVKILIEEHPSISSFYVPIKNANGEKLCTARAGSVVTIKIKEPTTITLCGQLGRRMFSAPVVPGRKYKATWRMGLVQASISSCYEVDII